MAVKPLQPTNMPLKTRKRKHATDPAFDERRTQFKKGLALLETTQVAFAEKHGVSMAHLQEVLRGRRVSARLNALIDEVIDIIPRSVRKPPAAAA